MASLATDVTVVEEATVEAGVSRLMRVINPTGLHLRAAAAIVRLANSFAADIILEHDGVRADADSIMSIACLGAAPGAVVAVTATGLEAAEALDALENLFIDGFGEGVGERTHT